MARTVSLLGAVLPRHLMHAQSDNPIGFWESERIADLNDEILGTLDSGWDDVFSFMPRPYLSNFDRMFVGRAVDLLLEEFADADLIALKDPRLSVLTAFWERALREAGYQTSYVIMVRHPLEVADSLRTRNNFPREKSLLLWSSYMLAVERDTRGLRRIFVSYDHLMSDWRKVRARIQQTVGVPFPRDTAAAANDVDRFLESDLRHHVTKTDDLATRADVPQYMKTLHAVFQAACEGAEIDQQAVDAVEAELTKIEGSVGSILADLRARARSLEKAVDKEKEAAADAREALLDALQQKASSEDASSKSIAALSEELRQKDAAILEAHARLAEQASREAEQAARVQELNERLAALSSELSEKSLAEHGFNQRLSELSRKLEAEESAKALLSERVTTLAAEHRQMDEAVRQSEEALNIARTQKRSSDALLQETQEMLGTAHADKQKIDARLRDRFEELASLTRMLAESEARARRAQADADWLREAGSVLLDGSGKRTGLLALLPASVHAKRQRRLLKQMGLFDEEAYLASNPDVAAEGADPLRHYVKHGLSEDRGRG